MPPQYPPYNAYPQQWNTPMPWQNINIQNPPWQQGWRGYSQGNVPPQYPTYPQYPPQYPQNQGNFSHPPMPQLKQPPPPLQLQNLPRPTQIPTQPVANPNNRVVQPAYNIEIQPYPTYVISTLPIQEVELRSGRVLP